MSEFKRYLDNWPDRKVFQVHGDAFTAQKGSEAGLRLYRREWRRLLRAGVSADAG